MVIFAQYTNESKPEKVGEKMNQGTSTTKIKLAYTN